ncbi:glycoside hydrolase family 32 protein [Streptomyces sp. NPDC001833]|uniref:glycoside hydrolase family 32 protein n=1 Tax=Streptomyces sp. NPDC001833 TaxID=3154658 RepID=UPI00332FC986
MSTAPFDPLDPHRPVAHLRPPRNWINDPNGLAFHDGYYHVCYQYNPHGTRHENMHWGHFRSPDLLSWEPLPLALAPTAGGEDADGCFSGNAVSDGDRLIAFYSALRQDRWYQPVTTATSRDGGRTFRPRGGLVIPEPPDGCTMYRDPYVWRDGARWRMLVGAALADGRGAALLYESPDLETWTYRGPFCAGTSQPVGSDDRDTGEGWECPQYLPAASGHGALIYSAWDDHDGPSCSVALTGHETGDVFEPGAPVLLDHGPDCYAPALMRAPGSRWLLWGWSWEARDEDWAAQDGWAGTLTLPREISLADDGSLHQLPASELLALRGDHSVHAEGRTTGADPVELGEVGRSFDLTARLDTSGEAGLRLVTAADGSEYLDIRLDPATGHLVVDRDRASRDGRARGGSHRMPCPADRPVDLRVVVDHSIAEIFLTSTGQVLTLRFYPTGADLWRLQARSAPGAGLGYAVDAWELLSLVVKAPSGDAALPERRSA